MQLSFEFMGKTKNIPIPFYTTNKLYMIKSFMVLIWILLSHLYTTFIYFDKFLLCFGVGFLLIIATTTEKRPLRDRWPQIYFLLVGYAVVPFATSSIFLICLAIALVVLMEYIFIHPNGFIIHPVVLVLMFVYLIDNTSLLPHNYTLLVWNNHLADLLYSCSIGGGVYLPKLILTSLLGLTPTSPSNFGGILFFFLCLFPVLPRYWYREASFFLGFFSLFVWVVFLLQGMLHHTANILMHSSMSWVIYMSLVAANTSLFFICFFFISESLGWFAYRFRYIFLSLEAVILWFFLCLHVNFLSFLLAHCLIYILYSSFLFFVNFKKERYL